MDMRSSPDSPGDAKPPRVVVIDDERGPRESLRVLLKPTCDVVVADSVARGLESIREQAPDLVILDIRMPERTGIQGLGDIREADEDLCVFMLTGYGDLDTAREAIRLGADDYIRKPFDTREMLALVHDGVRRTRERRAERRQQAELTALAQRLQADLSRHARMAALGLASSEMLHDIRNPLGIIMGYADLLRAELARSTGRGPSSDTPALEYLDSIRNSLVHCTEILESWRALGKAAPQTLEAIPVARFLGEIAMASATPQGSARPLLKVEPAARREQISGDRVQLRRAVQNVVQNALQAVEPPAAAVILRCRRDGDWVEIAVEDNGPGIAAEVLPHVFDAFHTTRGDQGGTGLGLFIARQVIETHEGSIAIRSVPGQGTTVSIRLPRLDPSASHG